MVRGTVAGAQVVRQEVPGIRNFAKVRIDRGVRRRQAPNEVANCE